MIRKIRWFITAVTLTSAVALVVFLGAGRLAGTVFPVFGQDTAGVVLPGAILKEENAYLCGDVELIYQAPAPADVLGKDLRELSRKYPEKEGWSVEMKNGKMVVLQKKIDGFCGEHSQYRHLGIYRERLAVYQGPLGFNQRLLRVEEKKKVEGLPPALRDKLFKARDYNCLPAEEKSGLRSELEFIDENALYSALENLDEMPDRGKKN